MADEAQRLWNATSRLAERSAEELLQRRGSAPGEVHEALAAQQLHAGATRSTSNGEPGTGPQQRGFVQHMTVGDREIERRRPASPMTGGPVRRTERRCG